MNFILAWEKNIILYRFAILKNSLSKYGISDQDSNCIPIHLGQWIRYLSGCSSKKEMRGNEAYSTGPYLEPESTSLIECEVNFNQNYPNTSVIWIFILFFKTYYL
jgi:hypothetical protein